MAQARITLSPPSVARSGGWWAQLIWRLCERIAFAADCDVGLPPRRS